MTGFLDLPPELRNRIYEYYVPHKEVIPISKCVDPPQSPYQNKILSNHESIFPRLPVFSGVNRQIRAEALSMYFGGNTFDA